MESPLFLEDIYPQELLYGIIIRSPVAKGRLEKIQYPQLPENYFFITAKDIPGENILEETSMPILAYDELNYTGEPVALLLGQNKTKLEELAKQCMVVAVEEKPVFSWPLEPSTTEPAAERKIEIGDTKDIFRKKGKIIADSFTTEIQDHWYAEPSGAVTWLKKVSKTKKGEKTGEILVVKTATQWPYHVKRSVAKVLGFSQDAVLVEPTALNLHMDGKLMLSSLLSCHAALGSFISKKPVRLILNREEDFFFSPKRCKTTIDIASIVDTQGNILATEAEINVNLGYYEVNKDEILDQICLGYIGFYDSKNVKISARAFQTNIPPQGPFSGFGLAQGFFAKESHISHIADVLSIDPALLRKERADLNLILPQGISAKNQITIDELIDKAALESDYFRKWSAYELIRNSRKEKTSDTSLQGEVSKVHESSKDFRGIGIALGFQGNGLLYFGKDGGSYGIEVTLTKESTIEIKASITSTDEDYNKIWAKLASEILSIEPKMVKVITAQAPDCGPSCASRNITVLTKLVEKCCFAIRKQRFHEPLPITVKRTVKPKSGSLWKERIKAPAGKIMDINGFSKLSFACAVVEVSINQIECIPEIRGVWLVVDGGKIYSKNRSRRNLTRAVNQALGWSFAENIEYTNGVLQKKDYENFALFTHKNTPLRISFLSKEKTPRTAEAKGIGELPFTCIPAAFTQAVCQAMDHWYKTIPLKREELWETVQLRNTASQTREIK